MGKERLTVSAKITHENKVWLECLCHNFGVEVSVSKVVDAVLTYVRMKSMAGEIHPFPELGQALPRNDRNGLIAVPGPRKADALQIVLTMASARSRKRGAA